jgi:hypothetical protein
MMLILLLQATSFIYSSLLLRCGDIESNPGPGIYPGKLYTNTHCNNVIFIIINARRMRTRVTVVSLSVCLLSLYCLCKTFM